MFQHFPSIRFNRYVMDRPASVADRLFQAAQDSWYVDYHHSTVRIDPGVAGIGPIGSYLCPEEWAVVLLLQYAQIRFVDPR